MEYVESLDFDDPGESDDSLDFDDVYEEGPLTDEPTCPEGLLSCPGIPRKQWATKAVVVFNTEKEPLFKGICHCIDPTPGGGGHGNLGNDKVLVQITPTIYCAAIPKSWEWSLRPFVIDNIFLDNFSLRQHDLRASFDAELVEFRKPKRMSSRRYCAPARTTNVVRVSVRDRKLSTESINLVASKTCCRGNCVQLFPRDKIRILRTQMYDSTDFRFKNFIKLEVHRQIHRNLQGRQVVTLEGIDVCQSAWMHILGVSKSTYYAKRGEVNLGRRATEHGNTGLLKPREHLVQATATLRTMLERVADRMPHKSHTLCNGQQVVCMSLPASFKWKSVIPELNRVNALFDLPSISQSGLSKIRKNSFSEYSRKSPGDTFARCSICDKYKSLVSMTKPGSRAQDLWRKKLDLHLGAQRSHRELYYANRNYSVSNPREVLTVIHDKMDHAKTALPLFSHKTKMNDGWMKLPIAVTGIIAHGHGDVRYAHYGLDFFPSDCNHTVGSFAKLLRDLEKPPKSVSRLIFDASSGSTPLFGALLDGKEVCDLALPMAQDAILEESPLPPILNVQLDNAASDNKNRYMLCYWSLLVFRGHFREIYVNFLLVGHTHDDIDALFGRWSMRLRQNDYPTLPYLMKSFMDAESHVVIPHLIEEVPDFKGYIADYIAEGPERLVGHLAAQQFKFYKHANGWPMMQYKIRCTDSEWLPVEDGGIKLWKEDEETSRPLIPELEPFALQRSEMRNLDEILKGLKGFIGNWKMLAKEDVTGEYRRKNEHVIDYWTRVVEALQGDGMLESPVRLSGDFWPKTKVGSAFEDIFQEDGTEREEFGDDVPFVGRHSDRPRESFRVARDLYAGYFIVVRPAEEDPRPFWIARALTDFNADRDHPNMVEIQYFTCTSKSRVVLETYVGWDSNKALSWKVDDDQPPMWLHTDSIMTSWKSNAKLDVRKPIVKIPQMQIDIIKESLVQYEEE